MPPPVVNFQDKLGLFTEPWSPRIVAQMNDVHFKLARVQGEFVWHAHSETDEVFVVLGGEMVVDFRDGPVTVRTGEMIVVPRGVEHRPRAESECQVLVVEPAGTVNTGDAGGDRTTEPIWI